MYDKSDPRASLNAAAMAVGHNTAGDYLRFYDLPPRQESNGKLSTWYARGQNFVIIYLDAQAGAEFVRKEQVDEYTILLPDEASSIEIEVNGEQPVQISGNTITFVPPGNSSIQISRQSKLILIFTSRSKDLCERCLNASSYIKQRVNIPPFQAWPEPIGGFKLRTYTLNVPPSPGRFGRIWRCSTLMINFLPPQFGPRDVTKLSPHHHNDFEQGSFVLEGEFVHHVRWPWTPNYNEWLTDEHEICRSPSLAVIPPPAVHTSMATAAGLNQLIDIFSPPRMDFSLQPGWVLNEDEYPSQ